MVKRKARLKEILMKLSKINGEITEPDEGKDQRYGKDFARIKDVKDTEKGQFTIIKYTQENKNDINKLLGLYKDLIKWKISPEDESVKERIAKKKRLGLISLHDGKLFDYVAMQERVRILKPVLRTMRFNSKKDNLVIEGQTIEPTRANYLTVSKLIGYYDDIQRIQNRRNKFQRGNNECAVIIPNKELAEVFARQFEKDWNYSKPNVPEGYGHVKEKEKPVSFKGSLFSHFNTMNVSKPYIQKKTHNFNKIA